MYLKITLQNRLDEQSLNELAYSFDCTFFWPICLTAKALRSISMLGFLVGANEPEKCTLKRVQLRFLV